MRLTGKRALVTGATGEIGRAIVARLANEGAEVAAAGRDQAKLQALAADGSAAHTFTADVTDTGSCEALIAEAEAALSGLDVLVNGAGVLRAEDGD
ncbi:MAG: SDR family NAD(P)-dependent oxidoreductase, partial [Kiloniellales bacterium]|nr:SDR family NAD(P)-dependent oxidoreductase [Kiloniellales bacterium]